MSSSLRKYQTNPSNLLGTAIQLYRSKRIQTAVVEGKTDKRFLSQWFKPDAKVRFDGFNGKNQVEAVYHASKKPPYSSHNFLYFFADVDFDGIEGRNIIIDSRFVHNAYCHQTNKIEFNDLEIFLVNNSAFEKLLANHDIEISEACSLRHKLEAASRIIGSFRAADLSVKQKLKLSSSILNGIEIEPFFSAENVQINEDNLIKQLPYWANYREHVDDLVEEAYNIRTATPNPWALSRGHDVTEMITLHFNTRGFPSLQRDRLELMLRLACEYSDFKESAMGRKLSSNSEFLRD